ncbi:hypothetical protein AOLI_G00189750 [Acnodon oligacanthus]
MRETAAGAELLKVKSCFSLSLCAALYEEKELLRLQCWGFFEVLLQREGPRCFEQMVQQLELLCVSLLWLFSASYMVISFRLPDNWSLVLQTDLPEWMISSYKSLPA